MKKILFISPTREWLRMKHKGDKPKGTLFLRLPSLAAPTLAALTPKEYEFAYIDEQVDFLDFDEQADLVAIICNTSTANRAYEIADEFKKRNIPVIIGGVHPTLNYDEARSHGIAVSGPAEPVWEEILNDFENGNLKELYHGNYTKFHFATPDRRIFKNKPYAFTAMVETSRGCIHHCNFCSTASSFSGKFFTKNISEVIDEIKSLDSKFIMFVDDNIIGNPEHAKKLFQALIPLKIKWGSETTYLMGLNEELLDLAAKSGCVGVFVGFEAVSDKTLEAYDKGFGRLSLYRKAIDNFHKKGIMIQGSFIFGSDNDNIETFDQTFKFIEENEIDGVFLGVTTPLPQTPLFNKLKEENRITDYDWDKYDYKHCVFSPKQMTKAELVKGMSRIHRKFFRLDRIIFRLLKRFPTLVKRGSLHIFLAYYLMSLSRLKLLRSLRQLS
ncbi:MAG: B12-binding domain-containing radical SAM protein [Nanoarchaeota archaeon]|nr:MAG: B12-binding domain-containing radical SAM protein [Nanoarchaeota archaeon]